MRSDFSPITGGVESVTCLAVSPSLPVKIVKELMDYAARNPGKLSYGTSGSSGAYHLSGLGVKMVGGIDMQHIAYKGLQPVATAPRFSP